jgi:catechol 2,3-dioxygenase-like lactoylglutathione lyase family enzyme
MTVGDLDHLYYWTRDMDAAVAFYRDVVGLELVRRDGDAWAQFEAGPVRFALHGTEDEAAGRSGTVVFRVEDLEAARWDLEQRGARFEEQVGEVGGFARFATFRDPDGNSWLLQEVTERLPGR